jgi:hypothetical protein
MVDDVSMMSESFDAAYRRLVSAFGRYHDAPRSPDSIPQLGAARWDLHKARNAMSVERRRVAKPQWPTNRFSRTAVSPDDLAKLRVRGLGTLES